MITTKLICHPKTFGNSTKPNSPYYKLREKIRQHVNNELVRIEDKKVEISIRLYITKIKAEKSDLDNYLKPIIDGISDFYDKWTKENKIDILKKEFQIESIYIKRKIIEKNENEGIIIKIK